MSFKLLNRFLFSFFNDILTVMKNVHSGLKTIFDCNFFFFFVIGKLVLTVCEKKGFGGAMMFTVKCCGCWTTEIDYKSSQLAQNSRR